MCKRNTNLQSKGETPSTYKHPKVPEAFEISQSRKDSARSNQ